MTMRASCSSSTSTTTYNIAIIGGGITGACVTSTLLTSPHLSSSITIDIFDQGRTGPGGRSNTRHHIISHPNNNNNNNNNNNDNDNNSETTTAATTTETKTKLTFDHGCQFFRADSPRFRKLVVDDWITKHGWVSEWNGSFIANDDDADFFGMPHVGGPYYVGSDGGMKSLPQKIISHCVTNYDPRCRFFGGTRISHMEQRRRTLDDERSSSSSESKNKWHLQGYTGIPAYHDTSETIAAAAQPSPLGHANGYDAVILTDISSTSFQGWHRASAGVPPSFATRVKERCGARVPLFTVMVAYPREATIDDSDDDDDDDDGAAGDFDAVSFNPHEGRLWFAARMGSKPGMATFTIPNPHSSSSNNNDNNNSLVDCWSLISTPTYAISKITETPMRDLSTGSFIPQTLDYLSSVPGPELEGDFRRWMASRRGVVLPEPLHVDAQRWGSALPSSRRSDDVVGIAGTEYSPNVGTLAPTSIVAREDDDDKEGNDDDDDDDNFVVDEELMLFQAGDMVSKYSPGFEGAALSGLDVAEKIIQLLTTKSR